MWFLVEQAVDETLTDWDELGTAEADGVGADAFAVERLAAVTGVYRVRRLDESVEVASLFSVDSEGRAHPKFGGVGGKCRDKFRDSVVGI